ncbi:histidine kinase [Antrihabitans sp. YC2-6]|uniref:sensor histidine kinase n=1 Tax=Antrihabitans sp. YC2-6 TaxID=2799498 RepID=UPI0018F5173D|nr:histidine kinase [Antrihabitans sp. YC2-6]MBJ8346238.1 sensor histidine kinase [Antrihabitans sp. YC2-6]
MSRASVFAVVSTTAALTAAVAGLVDWPAFTSVKNPLEFVLFAAVGWAFAAAGIAAWRTRPHDNTGRLMVLAGQLWLVRGLNFSSNPLAFTIGWALIVTYFAVLIHIIFGFPLGRLRSTWEKWFVGGLYFYYIGSAMAELAFSDPGHVGGERAAPINLLLIRDDPAVTETLQTIFGAVDLLIGIVVIGVLARRWRKGTAAYRAAFLPLWIVSLLGTAVVAILYSIDVKSPGSLEQWGPAIGYAATAMSPLAVVIGLWRYRVARGAVSDVMVEVGAAPLGDSFTTALRRALRDPSLVLWSWAPELQGYVDGDGRVQALPADHEDPRAATVLERDGLPVGALVYDRSLRDQPQLIAAVRSAATVALDNHRLQAELEAQLDEVRQSRGRIVAAGDAQRQRLERDLHDGAQQRLVAAAILLRRAQRTPNEQLMRDLLGQGAKELDAALVELRELARGVYPPVLQERGLGSALTSLAERSPLPVEIDDQLPMRPPPQIELAAYFIAAEAVTNASKHADATLIEIVLRRSGENLELVVTDDGCGGATMSPGGGLSGLRDRASALAGDMALISPRGHGTVITVTLPW